VVVNSVVACGVDGLSVVVDAPVVSSPPGVDVTSAVVVSGSAGVSLIAPMVEVVPLSSATTVWPLQPPEQTHQSHTRARHASRMHACMATMGAHAEASDGIHDSRER